jgi:WD40 repeat protein
MVSNAPGQLITGDSQGALCVWNGKVLEETIDNAHSSRVTALCKFSNPGGVTFATSGFLSASSDGVKMWSNKLEQLKFFPLAECMAMVNTVFDGAHVKSICIDAVFKRLLVTISNSTMLEISIDSGAVMLVSEGHMSLGNVAIAAHPSDPNLVVTGGFDGFLKLWDARTAVPVETLNMGEPISNIAFKGDGKSFVLSMNEMVAEMNFDYSASVKMQVKCKSQSKIGKGKLTSLRFHHEENVLVAGGSDGNVYVLDTEKMFAVLTTLKGHSHAIDGVDISVSGKYMRTFARDESGVSVETKFYQLEKGGSSGPTYQACSDSLYVELANVVWCTAASPAAPQARGTLVADVNVHTTATSPSGSLLAVSYSNGNVKMFRNPAGSVGAEGVNMPGHSRGRVNIAFNSDSSKLYSIGAQDGAIFVWDLSGK